ncbi:MAG TPA: 1-phosphofructokinase family hexose kinase [bacterium]|uniref:6-phosphofructokinase isozyme 2 n=1 Tax=candidate division TA06 bacterium ADurb.Bin417 TaxID=1852828 RepID=A0A1V5MAE1_UNCT6|nr:MAG: 6-phosphofructokinase isozyme 2 [candidate division TA06 bacterium ADurb.Bin417]HNQ34616.1 1-phosphofructokinase family hexose kinase [bacterium]HNS48094.1 1-phosphofructokinase family hexose kinase [bacterium]
MDIYTLTCNPSQDFYLEVIQIVPEDINRSRAARRDLGGKGINVSRGLKSLGSRTRALGLAAGDTGRWILNQLKREGIPGRFFRAEGENRVILNIREGRTGRIYRFNEPGPRLDRKRLRAFWNFVCDNSCPRGSFFAVCGSAPPGFPADFYGRLITRLKERGIRTLLDCDHRLLAAGTQAGPEILKVNLFELARLTGTRHPAGQAEVIRGVRRLLGCGIKNVVVTLGAEGALALDEKDGWWARPPRVKARSTIGAGDALSAGLLHGLSESKGWAEALRLGVAAGTAAVRYPGTTFANPEEIRRLLRRVKIQPV